MRRLCTPVKNFQISVQGVFQVPKTAKMGTVESVTFQREVQLKWHNFARWKSLPGLVDIPRMCLLYVSFGGTYVLGTVSLQKKFADCHAVDYAVC